MTFTIYLGFGIYQNILAGTTTDFYYVITDLLPNANYTIRVESESSIESTQIISSTIYHFLESDEVTEPTVMMNNISQSTQTSMTTPISGVLQISNLLSDYLSFILIGGILIIILLFVLFVVVAVVTCCVKKRRTVKHTTAQYPHTNPMLFELPAHANEIYEQAANRNPAYMPEKDEKEMDLGTDKLSLVSV